MRSRPQTWAAWLLLLAVSVPVAAGRPPVYKGQRGGARLTREEILEILILKGGPSFLMFSYFDVAGTWRARGATGECIVPRVCQAAGRAFWSGARTAVCTAVGVCGALLAGLLCTRVQRQSHACVFVGVQQQRRLLLLGVPRCTRWMVFTHLPGTLATPLCISWAARVPCVACVNMAAAFHPIPSHPICGLPWGTLAGKEAGARMPAPAGRGRRCSICPVARLSMACINSWHRVWPPDEVNPDGTAIAKHTGPAALRMLTHAARLGSALQACCMGRQPTCKPRHSPDAAV